MTHPAFIIDGSGNVYKHPWMATPGVSREDFGRPDIGEPIAECGTIRNAIAKVHGDIDDSAEAVFISTEDETARLFPAYPPRKSMETEGDVPGYFVLAKSPFEAALMETVAESKGCITALDFGSDWQDVVHDTRDLARRFR